LTIVTDEGAAFGAAGDQFTYNLAAAGAVIPVPEPGSLQLMLAGLVGMGLLLRQRRKQGELHAAGQYARRKRTGFLGDRHHHSR